MKFLLCAALFFWSCTARAEGVFSGLWVNPSEPGWGVSIHHNGDVMFVTVLVYGEDGTPTWYVAPEVRRFWSIGDDDVGFAGALYAASGPVLDNTPFDTKRVTLRRVGDINVSVFMREDGGVTYSIDGKETRRPIRPLRW